MTTSETLNHLLNTMLDVILHSAPYPGQKVKQTFFPDIEMVKDLEEIIISNQNLEPSCTIEIPGYHFCILSREEIPHYATEHGDFPYLELTEVSWAGYSVVLSLQLKWAISESSQQAGKLYIGGGGVRVKFILHEGEWVSPDGPMATWMS